MRKLKQAPIFDIPATFEPATEPSDINWENRNYKKPMAKKIILLLIYFLCILMFNFFCQSWAAHSIKLSVGKYSDDMPCDEIFEMYSPEDLEHFAADEFFHFYQNKKTEQQGKI